MEQYNNDTIIPRILLIILALILLQVQVGLAFSNSTSPPPRPPVIQALNRLRSLTPRRDILKGFQIYNEGFQVASQHYWASVLYTGIWGFIVAILYFIFANTVALLPMNFGHKNSQLSRKTCITLVTLIILFSCMAIISSCFVIWGSVETKTEYGKSKSLLFRELQMVVNRFEGTTKPFNNSTELSTLTTMLGSMVNHAVSKLQNLATYVRKKGRSIMQGLSTLVQTGEIFTIVLALQTSGLVLLYSVTSLKRKKWAVTLLGNFVSILWIFSGILFVVTNIVGDACDAAGIWSREESGMQASSQCYNLTSAKMALGPGKAAMKMFIKTNNLAINAINTGMEKTRNLRANKTFIPIKFICDPYGDEPAYNNVQCPANETTLDTYPQDFLPYRCAGNSTLKCAWKGYPIAFDTYENMDKNLKVARHCYHLMETLTGVMTCSFVRELLHKIYMQRCPNLDVGLSKLWFGFTCSAVAMACLHLALLFSVILVKKPSSNVSSTVHPAP